LLKAVSDNQTQQQQVSRSFQALMLKQPGSSLQQLFYLPLLFSTDPSISKLIDKSTKPDTTPLSLSQFYVLTHTQM